MNIYDLYTRDALATQPTAAEAAPALSFSRPWWSQGTPWFVVGGAFAAGFVLALLVF